MTIGERIKSCRETANLTQDELAKRLATTKQTIYKYENNIVTNIPSDKIEKMAEFETARIQFCRDAKCFIMLKFQRFRF